MPIKLILFAIVLTAGIVFNAIIFDMLEASGDDDDVVRNTMPRPDIVTVIDGRRCAIWRTWVEIKWMYAVRCVGQPLIVVDDFTATPLRFVAE